MSKSRPALIWRFMKKLNKHILLNLFRRGKGPQDLVLLLTTIGRKSGKPHIIPLQYEQIDNVIYIGSARGSNADWVRNIEKNPEVKVQIKNLSFEGLAEVITNPSIIADFFEVRIQNHPFMIRMIMHIEGLPFKYSRSDLERFAGKKVIVRVRRQQEVF